MSFVDRSIEQASQIRFARVALTILAAPFYLLGLFVGFVVVVCVVAFGAVKLGVIDVRARAESSRLVDADDA